MKKYYIHENQNNHGNETNFALRIMTKDDIPAVEQIEQTCFSDAWSEKLLSDMLESEWDEAWVLADKEIGRAHV